MGAVQQLMMAHGAAAGGAAIVYDTFTDTDSALLVTGPHTPETGGAWDYGPGNSLSDTLITSNRLRGVNDSTTTFINTATPPSADYDVEAEVHFFSIGTSFRAGPMGRAVVASNDYYGVTYNSNTGNWELYKVLSGGITVLGSWADSPVATNTRIARLEMIGTGLEAFIDGVSRITATDSSLSAAGKAGCFVLQGTDTTGYALNYMWAGANGGTVGP